MTALEKAHALAHALVEALEEAHADALEQAHADALEQAHAALVAVAAVAAHSGGLPLALAVALGLEQAHADARVAYAVTLEKANDALAQALPAAVVDVCAAGEPTP